MECTTTLFIFTKINKMPFQQSLIGENKSSLQARLARPKSAESIKAQAIMKENQSSSNQVKWKKIRFNTCKTLYCPLVMHGIIILKKNLDYFIYIFFFFYFVCLVKIFYFCRKLLILNEVLLTAKLEK